MSMESWLRDKRLYDAPATLVGMVISFGSSDTMAVWSYGAGVRRPSCQLHLVSCRASGQP